MIWSGTEIPEKKISRIRNDESLFHGCERGPGEKPVATLARHGNQAHSLIIRQAITYYLMDSRKGEVICSVFSNSRGLHDRLVRIRSETDGLIKWSLLKRKIRLPGKKVITDSGAVIEIFIALVDGCYVV